MKKKSSKSYILRSCTQQMFDISAEEMSETTNQLSKIIITNLWVLMWLVKLCFLLNTIVSVSFPGWSRGAYFLCLMLSVRLLQTGLWGFPSEGRRWYCSLRFASAALIIQWFRRQRGILGAQTRNNTQTPGLWRQPLFLTNNVFTLMSVMLGRPREVFFNLCFSTQFPLFPPPPPSPHFF